MKSAASHAVATVVTQVAIAVADRDAATVVTARCIDLETSELVAWAAVGIGFGTSGTVSIGVAATLAIPVARLGTHQSRPLGQRYRCPGVFFQPFHDSTGWPLVGRRGDLTTISVAGAIVLGRWHAMVVTTHESQSQPSCDVIDNTLGDSDVLVGRVTHWFEPGVAELVDQHFQWHAVLQCDRQRGSKAVHDPADRRTLFRHRDENLTGSSIWIQTDAQITLVARDRELMSHALASVRQAFAAWLVDDLFNLFDNNLRCAGFGGAFVAAGIQWL